MAFFNLKSLLITIMLIVTTKISANGSYISPYVGFGYNPIVRFLNNDQIGSISPFYGYGLANALGFGFDYLSYYGKPWYGGYGIGYPFGNGYGLGYGMGMGYGFGFPAMNLGFGHGGIGYGVGYGVGYGAGYGAGLGPGVGGYGIFNKKEGFEGYDSGDFHKSARSGDSHEINVSPAASVTSPSITTMVMKRNLKPSLLSSIGSKHQSSQQLYSTNIGNHQ